jgi:hypothetical protein
VPSTRSGKNIVQRKAFWFSCPAGLIALALLAPSPARAEFFNDVRRTFQTDIPHFFQDDIPCAFGGQPTSHTRASCKSARHPAQPPADKAPPPGFYRY